MKIGSLCTGYGGLDAGLQMVLGGEVIWHSEYDRAPSRVLEHHWPSIPNHGDLTGTDWNTVEPVDALTAGYPCQPFSYIGKRKGTDDERHLWPHIAAAIRQLRPRLVFLENVAGHLSMGFGSVLGDLAEAGYDAEWICLPASAAGAPHRRDRVFIAAHPTNITRGIRYGTHLRPRGRMGRPFENTGAGASSYSDDIGGDRYRRTRHWRQEPADGDLGGGIWGRFEPAIRQWADVVGRPAPWPGHPAGGVTTEFTEWMQGLPMGHVTAREIGLTREQQARVLGNGVVPQQAALALRTLLGSS